MIQVKCVHTEECMITRASPTSHGGLCKRPRAPPMPTPIHRLQPNRMCVRRGGPLCRLLLAPPPPPSDSQSGSGSDGEAGYAVACHATCSESGVSCEPKEVAMAGVSALDVAVADVCGSSSAEPKYTSGSGPMCLTREDVETGDGVRLSSVSPVVDTKEVKEPVPENEYTGTEIVNSFVEEGEG
ncbi:hypothetical protein B0H17DRAFT_1187141 [Mycena rosella]|uniref:Uncharacterized protein n=1 Tax=Mycena rosella TaxID=1033263 RepID=A0AAD7C6Q8_MYCRO|nr:hypothetical protein B0H17DRAFT_1187141 [Mycena rosella]